MDIQSSKTRRLCLAMAKKLEALAEELVMGRMEEVDPSSEMGRDLLASAQADADDLGDLAALLRRCKVNHAKQAIRNLDTVARERIPDDIMDALFPTGRLEEDFKRTIAMVESKKIKVSLAELKAMIKEALKEQAPVQETSREAERNYYRAQAKLDREQPIPVNSSWENDSLGNTTLFLSLEDTLRSYNVAEVGTDRSRQNVFIRFTPKGKSK